MHNITTMSHATSVLVKMVARRKLSFVCYCGNSRKDGQKKFWVKEWLKNQEQIGTYEGVEP